MATYPRVPTANNKQYTLDSQIAAGANTLTLNESVAGVVRSPGYFVVDRVDSSGNLTPTKREYKYFTGVSGANLTGVSNSDGTDQVHAVGAIVEFVPNVGDEDDKYDVFTTEHSDQGQHTALASLSSMKSGDIMGLSLASLNTANIGTLNTDTLTATTYTGLPVTPVWVLPGTASAATTAIGKPLDMPRAGAIKWASVVLNSPISGASLIIDINKNFSSIFESGTRLSILGAGTFASTASINTTSFSEGDVFSVDIDAGGWFSDATVKFHAE